ncbi:hypothetical protein D9Q98_007181 [Chlorella vulgaris]|uniref:Uncharacterized protein n=1 Tax=Chlorella vulgaris TaxID=3077 RepID=A0A9D4YUP8_CHLVU|nr:hypothetical protein D9Q98_007181 [Chlorella vulgaris]
MVAKTRRAAFGLQPPSVKSPGKRRGRAPEARRQLVFDEPAAPPSKLTLTCGTALPSPDVAACEADEMEYQQHQQHCSQSVLTAQQEALEVASPSTPPAQCGSIPRRRASPSVPGTLPGSLETSLLYALQAWRQHLVRLQPLVKISDDVLLGALAVMREFAAVRLDLAPCLNAAHPHLWSYLAAALWMVAKLCGIRTQIPNRSLICQVTQVLPEALSALELDLLFSLDWNVAALLRQQGLLY